MPHTRGRWLIMLAFASAVVALIRWGGRQRRETLIVTGEGDMISFGVILVVVGLVLVVIV